MALHSPSHRRARKARVLSGIGQELRDNPPSVLAKTIRKKGKTAGNRQRVAILLSKARAEGVSV